MRYSADILFSQKFRNNFQAIEGEIIFDTMNRLNEWCNYQSEPSGGNDFQF